MGKGTIVYGGIDGQYQIQINYDRTAYNAELSKLTRQIAEYTEKLSSETDEKEKAYLEMYKLSFEKRKQYLQRKMPRDKFMTVWCADLTKDLWGNVGTIEIPGESTYVQIQPGYDGVSRYRVPRDGQLLPTVIATPAQTFYNLAMLPGWQKWKPSFRYGTISAIDGDTASVVLEDIKSSQQSLRINQTGSLSNVPIEYMSCNGSAFRIGDNVLIRYNGNNWKFPVIIGFRSHPMDCGPHEAVLIRYGLTKICVYDPFRVSFIIITDEDGIILDTDEDGFVEESDALWFLSQLQYVADQAPDYPIGTDIPGDNYHYQLSEAEDIQTSSVNMQNASSEYSNETETSFTMTETYTGSWSVAFGNLAGGGGGYSWIRTLNYVIGYGGQWVADSITEVGPSGSKLYMAGSTPIGTSVMQVVGFTIRINIFRATYYSQIFPFGNITPHSFFDVSFHSDRSGVDSLSNLSGFGNHPAFKKLIEKWLYYSLHIVSLSH